MRETHTIYQMEQRELRNSLCDRCNRAIIRALGGQIADLKVRHLGHNNLGMSTIDSRAVDFQELLAYPPHPKRLLVS